MGLLAVVVVSLVPGGFVEKKSSLRDSKLFPLSCFLDIYTLLFRGSNTDAEITVIHQTY